MNANERNLMTLAIARAQLARYGMVIRSTGWGDELRVNYCGGDEATAYYTDDLTDAVQTGVCMWTAREAQRVLMAHVLEAN